jgi:hypothetical protein
MDVLIVIAVILFVLSRLTKQRKTSRDLAMLAAALAMIWLTFRPLPS